MDIWQLIKKHLNVINLGVRQDTKLNLSPYYFKPGFAFGGSCLPKDVRALTYKAKNLDVDIPVINAIFPSNNQQIKNALHRVIALGKKKIGVLGFAFKAGTDDLRESPIVELIEILLGKGYSIKIYDRNVTLAKLYGANKEFIEKRIPHIAELMVEDINNILDYSEILIFGNKSAEFVDILPKLKLSVKFNICLLLLDENPVIILYNLSYPLRANDSIKISTHCNRVPASNGHMACVSI